MNRREALSSVALLFGGTIIGAEFFLSGCKANDRKVTGLPLSKEDVAYLDEIAETIIPTTDSPGAKAAKVGDFMNTWVTDCYEEKDQKAVLEGMNTINELSRKKFDKNFLEATPQQRTQLLTDLDKEANAYNEKKKEGDANHYFTLLKQMTVTGYFTSELGATKALRYEPVPGRYDGCYPYKKGDKAWAL